MHFPELLCPAAADPPPAQRVDATNDDREQDRPMDSDKGRDYADQGPLTEMDMEEDAEILTLLLKHMPSCIYAADTEQLVREQLVPELQTAMHTITMLARSAWMCIFSSQPAWMSCQGKLISFVQMMTSWRAKGGLSIRFANPILLSAGCHQNLLHGLVRILGRSCRYRPSGK